MSLLVLTAVRLLHINITLSCFCFSETLIQILFVKYSDCGYFVGFSHEKYFKDCAGSGSGVSPPPAGCAGSCREAGGGGGGPEADQSASGDLLT